DPAPLANRADLPARAQVYDGRTGRARHRWSAAHRALRSLPAPEVRRALPARLIPWRRKANGGGQKDAPRRSRGREARGIFIVARRIPFVYPQFWPITGARVRPAAGGVPAAATR